ncbi:MAG: asparagine synthase (glutamine-hydrolyzing) [Pseudomonadales bacterium]
MCGVAGYQGNKPQELITNMVAAIEHRGPDNTATEICADGMTALAHTRLSIIDLSTASNQPLWNSNKTHCIVFNGEIYNYKSLRDELKKNGYLFNSNGDAEVLLNLYIEYGEKSLEKLNGIFAFAIWIEDDRSLFIARDQMGVKPFYYAAPDSGFIFSSEIKSLLCDQSISREINRTAISHYLRYLWCPSPMTPLVQVKKLEPGHYLRVKNGKISEHKQYFSLPLYNDESLTIEESKSLLYNALEAAVDRQLVADVKVGAFLSGGLDSSAIVALAAKKIGAENLPCYTIDFDGGSAEGMQVDLPYAKKVAKHLRVPLEIVKVEADIINDLPKLIFQLDEPQADVAPLNAWYISALAREQGVKVLLSGAGGDDLLTGYRRHYALSKEKYWAGLPSSLRVALQAGTSMLPKSNPLFRRVAKAFEYAELDKVERLPTYFHWLKNDIVSELFLEPLIDITDPLVEYLRSMPDSMTELQKMLQLDSKFFLVDHNFNYTDKVSMAEGVEVRVPLVDMEVVMAAAKIPDAYKQHGKHGKWIFKKAMEDLLPKEVIYRPKTGFGAPVRPWIRNELRPVVDDVLSETAVKARGLFSYVKVKELIDEDRAGRIDAAYTILSLMSIELWFRQFIDKPVPSVGI